MQHPGFTALRPWTAAGLAAPLPQAALANGTHHAQRSAPGCNDPRAVDSSNSVRAAAASGAIVRRADEPDIPPPCRPARSLMIAPVQCTADWLPAPPHLDDSHPAPGRFRWPQRTR